jgi:hypothetical protein
MLFSRPKNFWIQWKTTRKKTTAEATYKNAKKSTAKPPYKRPEDRDRDTKFKQLKDLLKYGTISL